MKDEADAPAGSALRGEPARAVSPPAVSLRNIVKYYDGSPSPAVSNVSIDVREGEFLVLLGPSGCGKTTTLRLIAGLEDADEGEILFAETVVDAPRAHIFVPTERRNIGMVFQSYAIWPHMSVFENVAYPLRVRGESNSEIRARVMTVLDLVGLLDLAGRGSTQLSGGQQQRVALARSLIFNPRVLLLDEPLSNLDARLRIQMRQELKSLQRKIGLTMVLVTHDQAESMSLADRIIVMNKGSVEQEGSPEDIYERPRNRFVAEFVGSANFIEGTVEDVRWGTNEVRVKIGGSTSWIALPDASIERRISDVVTCTIRPERLTLAKSRPSNGADYWPGLIVGKQYFGDRREYEVELDFGPTIKVSSMSDSTFQMGDLVCVGWRPKDISLIDDMSA